MHALAFSFAGPLLVITTNVSESTLALYLQEECGYTPEVTGSSVCRFEDGCRAVTATSSLEFVGFVLNFPGASFGEFSSDKTFSTDLALVCFHASDFVIPLSLIRRPGRQDDSLVS